jgi:hypothetical protein
MKPSVLSTLTAVALSGAFAVAHAQTSTGTGAAADTSTSAQGAATMSNKDAAQALESAKKACKAETSPQAQQDCMKKAQDDYKASMKLRSETKGGVKADVPKE